jgi:dihydrofolate reductase
VTISIYLAASLDNFIATPDGGLDWLTSIPNPSGSDYGFAEFLSRMDAVVMGRKTFETVLGFDIWPYSVPAFVLSRSLASLPDKVAGKAELIRGEPAGIVKSLSEGGFNNLYLDGGVTIQGFLAADLIDEMIITRVPVLLGDGVPLFGKLSNPLEFHLVKTQRLNDTLAKSTYRRLRR